MFICMKPLCNVTLITYRTSDLENYIFKSMENFYWGEEMMKIPAESSHPFFSFIISTKKAYFEEKNGEEFMEKTTFI